MSSFDNAVESYEKQLRDWLSRCPACVLSPQVMLHARRGTAMVQVGQSFEFDERLHARDNPPNHLLAQLLVSLGPSLPTAQAASCPPCSPSRTKLYFHERLRGIEDRAQSGEDKRRLSRLGP